MILVKQIFKLLEVYISRSRFFLVFCNLYFKVFKNKAFVNLHENDNFIITEGNSSHVFSNKLQGIRAYRWGLKRRGFAIGSSYLLDDIKFPSGSIIFDCGANVGDLYLYFKYNNIDVEYHAFEPSPKEYNCLVHNVTSNSNNIGLFNCTSSMLFYVCSDYADSSFIKPKKYTHTINVNCLTGDKYISSKNIYKIFLLKIEAEGAEPEVLKGFSSSLKFIKYISVDCSMERGINEESTLLPVVNYLTNNGFQIKSINFTRLIFLFENKRF